MDKVKCFELEKKKELKKQQITNKLLTNWKISLRLEKKISIAATAAWQSHIQWIVLIHATLVKMLREPRRFWKESVNDQNADESLYITELSSFLRMKSNRLNDNGFSFLFLFMKIKLVDSYFGVTLCMFGPYRPYSKLDVWYNGFRFARWLPYPNIMPKTIYQQKVQKSNTKFNVNKLGLDES